VVNLAKNADGHTNWEDMSSAKAAEPKKPVPKKSGGNAALGAFSVGKTNIRHATLAWNDRSTGERYVIHNLTLATGALAVGKPMSLSLGFDLEYGKPVKRAPVALSAQAVYSPDALTMKSFEFKLDDSTAKGSFDIQHFASPSYHFDLAVDQFDLDKYLPPKPAAASAAKSAQAPAPIVIPLAPLRSLNVQGKFAIGKLKAFGIRSENIHIQVNAAQGAIHLGPNTAKLYGGSYRGDITLDVRGKTPQLKLDEKLDSIGLGPFLKDAAIFNYFSGNANLALALTASGGDAEAIKRTLNGKVLVAIKDGAIEGIDLEKIEGQIKDARQKAGDNPKELLKALPELKPAKDDKTTFSKLGATATVVNGLVTNNDLAIEGPHLHVSGKGKVDLPGDKFEDYEIRLSSLAIKINGPLAAPSIRPDWSGLVKGATKEKIEKKKDELQDKLKDKIKKLGK
jgi:AsmA protein